MEENNYNEEVQMPSQEAAPLIIDLSIKSFLIETIKWGKFLAIMGFVFTGLIALIGIGLMVFGSVITSKLPAGMFMGGFIGFIYMLMGLLYYFPSKYLYDFCVYIKQALILNDQESLAYAFSKMKSLYRFWGILMVIVLVFYAIGILFVIAMAIFAVSIAN